SENLGLGEYLAKAVFQHVGNLLGQQHPPGAPGHTDALLRHLVDAAGAVLIVQRVVDVNFQEPLLLPPTVARFRYPINHFLGTILGGADTDTRERFLRTLQRDAGLRTTNLFFNAFHYGDATFATDGSLPRSPRIFRNAVPHILRHLEHPDRYGSILDTEAW